MSSFVAGVIAESCFISPAMLPFCTAPTAHCSPPPHTHTQVLFLLYHYFEAREAYNAIRIFIAGYVWMTGFGNFSYYYKTGDFSIGRWGPGRRWHPGLAKAGSEGQQPCGTAACRQPLLWLVFLLRQAWPCQWSGT
jgi:hypothetical protein